MSLKTSKAGVDFIAKWEGFSPKACKCVSTEKYLTIGFGHYGSDVKPDQTITRAEALELLAKDIAGFEKKVNGYDKIYHFTQDEFDALVSFCYNVGNIKTLTADGKRTRKQIEAAWPLYCKSGGKTLRGLVRRRAEELEVFRRAEATPASKTNEQIAKEVIAGRWGNGAERKRKLTAAGYDYKTIQSIVNKLMKG